MKNKDRILEIRNNLENLVKDKSINLLNGGCTGDARYLSDELSELRLLGVKIDLPQSFTCLGSNNYFETCADIVRQINIHLHPLENWVKNHIDTLIASSLSIAALIISLCKWRMVFAESKK